MLGDCEIIVQWSATLAQAQMYYVEPGNVAGPHYADHGGPEPWSACPFIQAGARSLPVASCGWGANGSYGRMQQQNGSENSQDSDRPRSRVVTWVMAIGGTLGLVASWLFE